jgi:hypothetical protein
MKKDVECILELIVLYEVMEDKQFKKEFDKLNKNINQLKNIHPPEEVNSLLYYFNPEVKAELQEKKGFSYLLKLRTDKLYDKLKIAIDSDNLPLVLYLFDSFLKPFQPEHYYFNTIKGNYIIGA